jgi:hypothetical protein
MKLLDGCAPFRKYICGHKILQVFLIPEFNASRVTPEELDLQNIFHSSKTAIAQIGAALWSKTE